MPKPCLIIVFNHRYDKNIEVLKKMYAPRFSNIFFLVPFYDGNDPNVIPVYESSHYFQSFFAQGYHRFHHESFTHYLFTGDDCILNPLINEQNFLEITGIDADADFIPGIFPLHGNEKGQPWWHAFKGIDFFGNRKGAEIKAELPSREEAVERFRKHGIDIIPLKKENVFGTATPPSKKWHEYAAFKYLHWNIRWRKFMKNGLLELPYPVAGAYTDVLLINKETIYNFCRYCGIMSAAGLFVEIAVPTALLLSSKKIREEKDILLKGRAMWSAAEVEQIASEHGNSLRHLRDNFPPANLFLHPVKLSKWKNDL